MTQARHIEFRHKMPVAIADFAISCSDQSLSYGQFPVKVQRHLLRVPLTESLEQDGEHARTQGHGFDVASFIHAVCRWGGAPGMAGRVLKQNTSEVILRQFSAATDWLADALDARALAGAILELNELRQLGTPSLASLHLRFLRPDVCGMLDREIASALGYEFTAMGFASYSLDCSEIAARLMAAQIQNPRGRDGRWFAGDVDMALSSLIRGW
jgi:hypothetical protein